MDRHLVAVEVRVERAADERVDPDRLALDENRLEGLDPEPVERRRPVQQDRMLADHLLEEVPHLWPLLLDEFARLLDGGGEALVLEAVEQERLEELERHLLRQPALVQFQLRAHHDHRPTRIVHPLSEQVLPEPALLSLEGVRERLERPVVRPLEHPAPPPVVEQRVHRFLEHPLLVPDDHIRSAELEQPAQPVVPVDDLPVELVQIARREPSAVERHQRPQVGGDDRDDIHDHPLRQVPRLPERIHDLEALGRLGPLLDGPFVPHLAPELLRERFEVRLGEQPLRRPGPHVGGVDAAGLLHLFAELVVRPPEEPLEQAVLVLGDHLAPPQHAEPDRRDGTAFRRLLDRKGEELLEQLRLLGLEQHLPVPQQREIHIPRIEDHIGLVVENALELPGREVEDLADAARRHLEEPHMGHRAGELDVAEPAPPDRSLGDLDAALVADHPPVLHALVLAADAFPVVDRTEDLRAEESAPFGFQRPVVDRLGLRHLSVRPAPDLLRRSDRDLDRVEVRTERFPLLEFGEYPGGLGGRAGAANAGAGHPGRLHLVPLGDPSLARISRLWRKSLARRSGAKRRRGGVRGGSPLPVKDGGTDRASDSGRHPVGRAPRIRPDDGVPHLFEDGFPCGAPCPRAVRSWPGSVRCRDPDSGSPPSVP